MHPGYGFLAENAGFARALGEAGVIWIGPPPDAIDAMGSKTGARALMDKAGVPIVPGVTEPVPDLAAARPIAESIGYPVAVKAAAGGGGKGFRVAPAPEALEDAFEGARREGERFFADGTVYLERYLPRAAPRRDPDPGRRARHLRLAGRARLLDPAPPPEAGRGDPQPGRLTTTCAGAWARRRCTAAQRGRLHRRRARSSTWSRASEFFFLEMNTRIQVEHTVTEEVCRARPGARAGAGGGRRAALDRPGRGRPPRPRLRVPHQRRGRLGALHALPRPHHRLPRAGRARACASTRACGRARRSPRSTTR